jgi:hypothetical protein
MKKSVTHTFTQHTGTNFRAAINQLAELMLTEGFAKDADSRLLASIELIKFSLRMKAKANESKGQPYKVSVGGKVAPIIKGFYEKNYLNAIEVYSTARAIVDGLNGVKRKETKRTKTNRRFY